MKNKVTKLLGVIDRIEDGKVVVLNFNDRKGSAYIDKSSFNFKVYEGMWLRIEFYPEPEKENGTRLKIKKLQEELLKRSKK